MNTIHFNHQRIRRLGLTLVELLIVISILVLLTAIAVPSVRMVTKDRKIREAAREVNAMVASARDSSLVTGFSGIEFVRNPNFIDANGVYYACTTMYKIKARRVYAGDLINSRIVILEPGMPPIFRFTIRRPVNDSIFEPGDYVKIDYRGQLHLITAVNPGMRIDPGNPDVPDPDYTTVVCQVASNAPMPAGFNYYNATTPTDVYFGPGFQIFRQPVRDVHSRVDLPQGQYIDLRLSGHLDLSNVDANPGTSTLFGLAEPSPLAAPQSLVVMFDGSGAVDRVYPYSRIGSTIPGVPVFYRPSESLYLLVVADPTGNRTVADNLSNTSNLWVKVDHRTGVTTTSNAVEMTAADTIQINRIRKSRGIAQSGQTANQ